MCRNGAAFRRLARRTKAVRSTEAMDAPFHVGRPDAGVAIHRTYALGNAHIELRVKKEEVRGKCFLSVTLSSYILILNSIYSACITNKTPKPISIAVYLLSLQKFCVVLSPTQQHINILTEYRYEF